MKTLTFLATTLALLIATHTNLEAKKYDDKKIATPKAIKTVDQAITKVNLNKASAVQIATAMKGIGIKKAEAIIDLRNKLGGFKTIEQILDVKGIGEKTLAKNRMYLTL
ncbi:MAG: helix-hairpin-helix domain-containing protein [Kangiellaceae bacterium]|nr:helix-hairpin-helix domain-containing protein [Kangiellaceae bacterium]